MKAIINRRLYDTTTAKKIGDHSNNLSASDFNHFSETLYRKRNGEFFLWGEGGPMTKYAEADGNMTCSGFAIIPMEIDEAKDWVEAYLSVDTYIELFGEPEE